MIKSYFLFNLRKETYNDAIITCLNPRGYLLAPKYATKVNKKYIDSLRFTDKIVLIDNGNFSLINTIRKKYKKKSRELWLKIQAIEKQNNHSIYTKDVPDYLRKEYKSLAKKVRKDVKALAKNGDIYLEEQLKLSPTHIIGVEDITMATWLSLNIEPEYVKFSRKKYRNYNKYVTKLALNRLNILPSSLSENYYPVASAVSYNTAYDAGKIFAQANIKKISMGFGAYMADNNWIDHFYIGRKKIQLPDKVPNRYIRTVLVMKGFLEGYKSVANKSPKAFHFLGLGAPIMIPLVVTCSWKVKNLTFDATSPIKDATKGGTLYTSKPAFLKVRTRKVAFRLASDENIKWDCPCPFCQDFIQNYPFKYDLAHAWFKEEKRKKVTAKDLRPRGALYKAFPLFSEPKSSKLRNAINHTRIGHNHWILTSLMKSLRKNGNTKGEITQLVSKIVEDYSTHGGSKRYIAAIKFSFDLLSDEHHT